MDNSFTTTSQGQASSHLRPPVVPNFPFSSPITEEVESPENSLDGESAQQTQGVKNPFEPDNSTESGRNPFADNAGVSTAGQDEFALERYIQPEGQTSSNPRRRSSVTKPSRADSRLHRATGAKDRRPGLNVLTNFSRNAVSKDIKRVQDDSRRPSLPTQIQQSQQPQQQGYNFVDLNDLKSLSKAREKERFRQKNKLFFKKQKGSGSGYLELKDPQSGRNNSVPTLARNPSLQRLKAASGRTTDLSPSDRPIVIGISVPRDSFSESESNSISLGPQENADIQYQNTPITPSIIITPAGEDVPWGSPNESPELRSRRPASSVYSRATTNMENRARFDAADAPPVPSIPASHSVLKSGGNSEDDDATFSKRTSVLSRRQRSLSTGTVFEEDVSPLMPTKRPRSFSEESKLDIPTSRMSLDTIETERRSRGWWTYLLSPLLTRSSTLVSKLSPSSADRPAIPPFSPRSDRLKASPISGDEKLSSKEVSVFSPDTPTPVVEEEKKDNLAEWPDMDAWDGERGARGLDNDEPTHSAVSALTIPFMMSPSPITQGHAAEYFYACGHDQSNTSPFFKCVNHSCSNHHHAVVAPGPADPFSETNNGASSTRGLALMPNADAQLLKENPNNPFFQNSSSDAADGGDARPRSDSASTIIEDEPDFSPNVREAQTAPMMRAGSPVPTPGLSSFGNSRTPSPACFTAPRGQTPNNDRSISVSKESPPAASQTDSEQASSSQPPPYSPPKRNRSVPFPRYRAIMPPGHEPQPLSPSPISPGTQRDMSGNGAISMSEIDHPQPPPAAYVSRRQTTFSSVLRPAGLPVTAADIQHPVTARDNNESRRQRLEREDAMGKKVGGLWRGRGCFSERGCFGRSGREGRARRRWYIVIATFFVIIIVVAIVLATTLTRQGDETPIESQWLNLTGYPPMPTGISTIARPNAATANSGCTHPSTMWSCAVPKEEQEANKPNDPDQPNFRIQVRFQNGTFEHSTEIAPNDTSNEEKRSLSNAGNAVTAGRFIKEKLLRARNAFTDALNKPSPSPPSTEEQIFLGNTTDKVKSEPFDGEETPFFITFLSPSPVGPSALSKRADNNTADDSPSPGTFPDVTSVIPPPSLDDDGTAAAANLYPLPTSQPVRLYDRGLPTEHYGFYTYYDRSVFLKSTQLLNNTDPGEVPADLTGGSSKVAANFRCTWAETRFKVRIWTRPEENGMALLADQDDKDASTPTSTASASSTSATGTSSAHNATMSATDFSRPGSFPYPVTVTLDRHGGNQERKMVYCYGMDARQNIVTDDKKLYFEFRGFGGKLVNPADNLFKDEDEDGEDDKDADDADKSENKGDMSWAGGVDGGTGGCSCEYRNWLKSSSS